MELNILIKKYIKYPTTWYFIISGVGIFLFSFLLIWFNIENILYGWMVGILISISFFGISYFFNGKMTKKKKSLTLNTHLQLLIKLTVFGVVFATIIATNNKETSWTRFNDPISGLMIIINYSLYSFLFIWNFKVVPQEDVTGKVVNKNNTIEKETKEIKEPKQTKITTEAKNAKEQNQEKSTKKSPKTKKIDLNNNK